MIDYDFWKFWITVANSVGTVLLAVWLFVTNRSRVNTARIDRLEDHTDGRIDKLEDHVNERIVEHDKWLERIEERNKHMPTHEDFKRVHARLDSLSEEYRQLSGEFKGASHTLNLIHEYLLKEGKK